MLGRKFKNRWASAGFTLIEMLMVGALVANIPQGNFGQAKQRALQTTCVNNLSNIGKLIAMEGQFPKAAFYPKDPRESKDSIRKILGGGDKQWVCPSMPEALARRGLTFVYNDSLAGQVDPRKPSKKWVLIEMSCVSQFTEAPHPLGYNVLFADGHVITTHRLPAQIQAAWNPEQ